MMRDQQAVDVGVGLHGMGAADQAGGGAAGWVQVQVMPNVQAFGRGHGTLMQPFSGAHSVGSNHQWGAGVGVRGTYPVFNTLLLGGELSIDYLAQKRSIQDGNNVDTTAHFVSAAFGFPVSEEALPGLSFFVTPTIGAGFRFGDVDVPFAGFMEAPVGVSWALRDNMVLVAEGGFAIPYRGGYGGVALSFRL
jgi:hypothetical protein